MVPPEELARRKTRPAPVPERGYARLYRREICKPTAAVISTFSGNTRSATDGRNKWDRRHLAGMPAEAGDPH